MTDKFTYIERNRADPISVYQGTDLIQVGVNVRGGNMGFFMSADEACELATALLQAAGRIKQAQPTPEDPPSLDARNIEYWERLEA